MDDRTRALQSLKAYGTHATSFQILEPGYSYWFSETTPEKAAPVIAYVERGRFRVAAGVPIAPKSDLARVANEFIQETRKANQVALFFSADDAFLSSLDSLETPPKYDAICIGQNPEWVPKDYTTEGSSRRTLRSQVQRATAKGVRVRPVTADELETPGFRAQIESVLQRWLDARTMSVMHFLVDLEPFHFAEERRYYVAEHEHRPVAFLAAIPVYCRNGWFFEDIIRVPDAPNGTVELLVDTAMRDAAARGDDFVTLGLAPLSGIPKEGPHPVSRRMLRWCYDRLSNLYHFQGLRHFKGRFHPETWKAQYLVQSPPSLGPGSYHAVLSAFAGGGLVRFGYETVLRWV